MNRKILLMLPILLIPAYGVADDSASKLDVEFQSGYDSNPFKLSDSLNDYESAFLKSRVMLTNRRNETGLYYRLNAAMTKFLDGKSEDADSVTTKAELGYRWRPETSDGKADYNIAVDFNTKDSTYYSKITGQKATFMGADLGDRYNANWLDLSGIIKHPISKDVDFVVRSYYRNKNYDDFSNAGVSNLDYKEFLVNVGFDLKWQSGWRWLPELIIKQRDYDDKRQAASDGSSMVGTDLEYDYLKINNELKYDINDIWDLKIFADYETREDNGSGYYDTRTKKIGTRIRRRDKSGVFSIRLAFIDRKFDNNVTNANSDIEEENKEKDGYEIKLTYKHEMKELTGFDWRLVGEYRRADYSNSDPFYIYDRTVFYIGFEGNLF